MARSNEKAEVLDFGFDEPDVEVRAGRRSWMDEAEQVGPVDALIDSFLAQHGSNGVGYARKVGNITPIASTLPEGKGEPANRIAQRVNQRAAHRELEVYAKAIKGTLNMVVGAKPVITRKKRNGDAAEPEAVQADAQAEQAPTPELASV